MQIQFELKNTLINYLCFLLKLNFNVKTISIIVIRQMSFNGLIIIRFNFKKCVLFF